MSRVHSERTPIESKRIHAKEASSSFPYEAPPFCPSPLFRGEKKGEGKENGEGASFAKQKQTNHLSQRISQPWLGQRANESTVRRRWAEERRERESQGSCFLVASFCGAVNTRFTGRKRKNKGFVVLYVKDVKGLIWNWSAFLSWCSSFSSTSCTWSEVSKSIDL